MYAFLLIVSAVLFLAFLNLWIWHLRKVSQLKTQAAQPLKFSSDLAALNAGSIGLGERLLKIERQQKIIAEQLEQLQLHDKHNIVYNQAIDLIKRGINKHDLMSSCDLSEAEAGLLMMMHKKKAQARAVSH